ncbi:AraC family transcriptional regulator [Paenibacillus sp. ACRRY]|uniref:AraC family transcriptional regulator n=1 Tax=Paenibacillus sp. ACRRY TaxID=2918208 RepID=UPI001EF443E9|nr:AraC family transcriptional regulator [Paenibacillus sp. ACRRY]MCG7384941.1 AraC family transcriptional regulator [Paenibacillus sp. ACRRY]
MMDIDEIAEMFARESFEIQSVNRLVLQPQSILREFRTMHHGFLFVIRGEARMEVDGMVYDLKPGTVFHAAPGMQLDSRIIGQSELEYYTLFYRFDRMIGDYGYQAYTSHFKMEAGADPRVVELLMLLQEHAYAQDGIGKLRVKELFLGIMVQILTGYRQREHADSPGEQVIREAVSYIHGHYMNPLTLNELAALHAMSSKRFSYYFYKYTGLRPIDYVIQYRMERARELLQTGNYLIRDVATSVGYTNPLYFSRVFKNKFGVSPSAFTPNWNKG